MKTILLLFVLSWNVYANPIDIYCPDTVIWGAPIIVDDSGTQYLCKRDYAINLNYKTRVANYVVEHIVPDHLIKRVSRRDNFHADQAVPAEYRAELSDYVGSKFDKGHLAPADDFTYDRQSMDESFLLSNMMPQAPSNNRGIWKVLETQTRLLAKNTDVYVISGTIYHKNHKIIGSGVAVPNEIYKIVIQPKEGIIRSYLFPNTRVRSGDLSKYLVSIKTLERKTGINFLPLIPADLDQ